MHILSPRPAQPRLYHSAEYRSAAHYSNDYFGVDGAPAPAPPKKGGLRALVSKFENMASGNKKAVSPPIVRQTGAVGTKGRGWRDAIGLQPKKEVVPLHVREETNGSGNGNVQRVDSLEFARNHRADEIKLERKERVKEESQGSGGSVKSQNSLIVRGKKEGMRLLNGLSGRKTRENKSGSQSKTKSNRRESLVQLRVRAWETAKGGKVTKVYPTPLREELPTVYRAPAPQGGSESYMDLTPTTTHTQGSSGGASGRQRQKLQKPKPISSKPNKSSNLLPKFGSIGTESKNSQVHSVDGSAKKGNVLRKPPPGSSQTRNRSETSSNPSVHDFEADPRTHVPSEAQVFSLAARADHGAPRKSVAPTIRERITMFESAKEVKGTSIVALLGAGATAALKRRIADEGAEDGAEFREREVMRRVEYGRSEEKLQSPQMGMVEEPSLTRGSTQRKQSKSPISRYLEERKRSSIASQGSGGDGKVNGKYQSAFANRHNGVASPETTKAVLHAVKATTPRKSQGGTGYGIPTSVSSPAKLGQFGKTVGAVVSRTHSPTLSPALQDMVMRRQSERNALSAATSKHTSRQPSPHSMDGHNSMNAKRNSHAYAQNILTGGPVRAASAVPQELIAPPAAPSGTPPGTIDDRVAELIALAAEDEEPIISKGVAEDYHEIERLGSAMGGMKEVPIGMQNQYLKPSKMRRDPGQTRISVVGVAARNVAPRVRTPLSRSRSSISRMLGRDGPPESKPDNNEKQTETSPTGGPTGENKENIPSDEDSLGGKEHAGAGRSTKEEMRKISETRMKEIRKREEEEKLLVIRSEVPISEPKPLRLVEISRMLRMARFGRSRSGGQRLSDMKV